MKGGGNCFIHRAVWAVCKLERIECVGEAGFDVVHDYLSKHFIMIGVSAMGR